MHSEFVGQIKVPFAEDVNLDELTKDDNDPMFVTVQVAQEGVSKNKRYYSKELIQDISRQINKIKPDAYFGHLTDAERTTKNPKSQTIWLGSVVKEINGKLAVFAKGYVLPYADELKAYLKKAKAASKQVAVSLYGQAEQEWNDALNGYKMKNFMLESIDWARSQSAGIAPSVDFQITAEMAGEVANREDVLGEVTVGELKAMNPSVVKAIAEETRVQVVSEMADASEGEMKTIREMLGEKPLETVKEMQDTIGAYKKKEVEALIDSTIRTEVKAVEVRPIIKRMVVSEMAGSTDVGKANQVLNSLLRSDEVQAIIKGVNASSEINPQVDNRQKEVGRKYTTV